MKKIYTIALAVLAAAALASCVKEEFPNEGEVTFGDNDIVFAIKGGAVTTRSDEGTVKVATEEIKKLTIPVKVEGSDQPFFLEQTIVDLNETAPITRGTPAYTENLGVLYTDFDMAFFKANSGMKKATDMNNAVFSKLDEEMVNGGWRYNHVYPQNPWPDATTNLYFFLRMPANATNVVLDATNAYNTNNGAIKFSYTSPATAADQQDILFASRKLYKEQHDTYLSTGGAPVLFHHALTGVKFALGNDNTGTTKTHVTKVTFTNLKNTGTCTVTPRLENGQTEYVDSDEYSSQSVVNWGTGSAAPSGAASFTAEYDATDKTKDNTITYSASDENAYPFGSTFYEGGITRNLNNDSAELTFWFIPQNVNANNQTLHVEFEVYDGKATHQHQLDLSLGQLLRERSQGTAGDNLYTNWKAGQLRTFTIKPNVVDVEIDDVIEENVKKNVVITNTGNVAEYVRCLITANWVNEDNEIVYGYTAATGENFVSPWMLNAAGTAANYGTFVGLPGGTAAQNNWEYKGGYYYYKTAIGPGASIPSSTTLFTSYTYTSQQIPDVWLLNPDNPFERIQADGVHLVMDIAVQAIVADGYDSYVDAWTATGSY